MTQWAPCKRRDFIFKLMKIGFKGPYSGSRHQFMVYDKRRLTIPSNNDYSVAQLRMMLKEAEDIVGFDITAEKWVSL
ncbi:type II toxin-antitoxin system HicA family toxin [Candidatus Magnetomonas plexicatena]|uniref:type II toxin-antitoxin system HicA family toxin n=1 Tax=Candidatus Magnetomonas plexicatena TaxID=2552947 RepID=UPI0040331011